MDHPWEDMKRRAILRDRKRIESKVNEAPQTYKGINVTITAGSKQANKRFGLTEWLGPWACEISVEFCELWHNSGRAEVGPK